jgi:RNA polymerase sigma-70 factor (ECF subfamily)
MSNAFCPPLTAPAMRESFDDVVLPHLDAAYRLACWLMRNEHDAEDVVQEASLRALRYFRTFLGGNGRAWFLRIVRNTCSGVRGQSAQAATDPFDEEHHSTDRPASDPETLLLHTDDAALIERAMSKLPGRSRELLALRELEGQSYRELADVFGTPIGTVMSRLSRARQAFRTALENELTQPGSAEDAASRTGARGRAGVNGVKRTATTGASGGSVCDSRTAAVEIPLVTEGGQDGEENNADFIGSRTGWSGERICA